MEGISGIRRKAGLPDHFFKGRKLFYGKKGTLEERRAFKNGEIFIYVYKGVEVGCIFWGADEEGHIAYFAPISSMKPFGFAKSKVITTPDITYGVEFEEGPE